MIEDIDLLALCSIPSLGPVTQRRLIEAFGDARSVFRATAGALMAVEGVSEKRAESITGFDGRARIEADLDRVVADGALVIGHESDAYPEGLRQLGQEAPLVIYVKGMIMKEDGFAVAVVGSRRPTTYGLTVAEKLSAELAKMGFTIVSGLARGIDSAAHKGALKAGGRSIGVLGSGIDVAYPAENRALMGRLAESGAVVSEFSPGTPPLRENFPRRNRLISGLSMGVLVVEAAEQSGTTIIAGHALEQGKEVFAVPGNINSPLSAGTNRLIRQGAKIVTRAEDVLEELAPQLKGFVKKADGPEDVELSGEERAVCDILSHEPRHVDDICRASGLPAARLLTVLLGLELKGVVRQTGGKNFHLA